MAGGIDHSIYFQQTTPDIMGGIQRGLQTRAALDEQKKQKAIQEAYNQGVVKNADGTNSFDSQKATSALFGSGNAKEAQQLQTQSAANQAALQKAQMQKHLNELDLSARVLGSVNDQQSWDAGKQYLKQNGVNIGQYENVPFDPNLKDAILRQSLGAKDQLEQKWKAQDFALKEKELGLKGREIEANKGGFSAGQKKVDQEFAQDYNDWTSGGSDLAQSEITKLKGVISSLKTDKNEKGSVTTGMMTGILPDRFTNNDLLKARSAVQSSIMSSLKALLGSAFTEKEGDRVLKNTWNEGDSTENNVARINNLVNDLQSKFNAKNSKAQFYQNNSGSLAGFKAQIPSEKPPQNIASQPSLEIKKTNEIEW